MLAGVSPELISLACLGDGLSVQVYQSLDFARRCADDGWQEFVFIIVSCLSDDVSWSYLALPNSGTKLRNHTVEGPQELEIIEARDAASNDNGLYESWNLNQKLPQSRAVQSLQMPL